MSLRGNVRCLAVSAIFVSLASTGVARASTEISGGCQRLYVFGDSYSDSGARYLDGNGPTAVVYLAHQLGLTFVPSDVAKSTDSINFAVSGATTGAAEGVTIGRAVLARGMRNQVDDFAARRTAGKLSFDPHTTLFFLAGGLNDTKLTAAESLRNLERLVSTLHSSGARRFVIARLPVLLINPEVGRRLNPELPDFVAGLRASYPNAEFRLSDWGPFFDQVYQEGARRGFSDLKNACAGRAIFRQDYVPCANPRTHYFYHDAHPSTEAHRQVGALLGGEALNYDCGRREGGLRATARTHR